MQEYPKALYRDGELITVGDYDQEEAARADGYQDWADDNADAGEQDESPEQNEAAPVVRRGRRPKAK